MNVLVLHSQVPFASGGAEVLVQGLVQALRERGHCAEVVALPYQWNPPEKLLTSALAWRLLDLSSFNGVPVDRVICTKFPTWAAQHPRKSLWLIHQHRQAYDLYGTPHSEFGVDGSAASERRGVFEIDNRGIHECDTRFAISRNVSERLKRFNGIDAGVLYPPVPHKGLEPVSFEPFILSAARLDELKRIELLLNGLINSDANLSVVIASDGPERANLEALAIRLGLANRVRFLGRITGGKLVDLYNRCRAVFYAPIDEDYGYSAVEALAAGKPVLAARDSGGVLEFVVDGKSGIVCEPDSLSVGAALNTLDDECLARRLGANGPALTEHLTWDVVVENLLAS